MTSPASVLAVDGGNSKADIALVAADGSLLAALRTPTISHQAVGLEAGIERLRAAARRLASAVEGPVARAGVFALAGADFPEDVALLENAIAATELTDSTTVLNDTFGALRAGTERPWGVALICGQGINAAAVAPDGRRARFDGVGDFSGDWGGANTLGHEALSAAVRAVDGRGRETSLERLVPAHFDLPDAPALTKALYLEQIEGERLAELSPLVFWAAGQGDQVARSILDRLADELSTMAVALLRRLGMTALDPEVVLAGGVFRNRDSRFYARLEQGIRAAAPKARPVRLEAPPVLGAALIGLDRAAAGGFTDADVAARLRSELVAWDAAARRDGDERAGEGRSGDVPAGTSGAGAQA